MKVVISRVRGDGTGILKVYEIDDQKFNDELFYIAPTTEEDWYNLADFVENEGKLLYKIQPDYTIVLEET